MPLFVISSRGVGLTTTRSLSGWSFEALFVALAVAKVCPSWWTAPTTRRAPGGVVPGLAAGVDRSRL